MEKEFQNKLDTKNENVHIYFGHAIQSRGQIKIKTLPNLVSSIIFFTLLHFEWKRIQENSKICCTTKILLIHTYLTEYKMFMGKRHKFASYSYRMWDFKEMLVGVLAIKDVFCFKQNKTKTS